MDNLGAHRGDRVRELIEERGCSLLYLPPYSPDFSPIEEAFSKVKALLTLLKKAAARTREALGLRPSAWRSRRLGPRTRQGSSATAATCPPLNYHENRCQSG
jgi:transposase